MHKQEASVLTAGMHKALGSPRAPAAPTSLRPCILPTCTELQNKHYEQHCVERPLCPAAPVIRHRCRYGPCSCAQHNLP